MKKSISPLLSIGLIIFVAYVIINRFIITLSNWITFPVLVVAIGLIFSGILKFKNDNN